jgi:hypothetical protein
MWFLGRWFLGAEKFHFLKIFLWIFLGDAHVQLLLLSG